MSALLEGFRTGWGAMSQHNQQQENKRRYDQQYDRQLTQDEMNAEMHKEQLLAAQNTNAIGANDVANIDRDNQFVNTSRALDLQNQVFQNQVNGNAASRIPVMNEREDTMFDLQSNGQRMSNESQQNILDRQPAMFANEDKVNALNLSTAELQQKEQKRTMLLRDFTTAASTGDPEVFAEFMLNNKDNLRGTNLAGFSTVQGVEAAVTLGDALNNGDLSTAAQAANTFFKPQLNKAIGQEGRNKQPITDIEISGIVEQGEGFRIPIKVTTADGKSYPSFISELRSSEPGDPAQYFSPERLIGTVKSVHDTAKMLYNSSYMQRLSQNASGVMSTQQTSKPDWKAVSGTMGNTTGYFDPNTKQFVQIPDGAMADGMASNPDALAESRENLKQQKRTELIDAYAGSVVSLYGNKGISQSDAKEIAQAMQEVVDTSGGAPLDMNNIREQEVENFFKVKEQLKTDRVAESKMINEATNTAFKNSPNALYR